MIILTMCLSGKSLKQLAGETTVPGRVICRRQIDKSTKNPLCFLSTKRFDPRLTFRVETQRALYGAVDINNLFDADVDKPLDNLVGNTEQRYQSKTFWVSYGLHRLWDCNHKPFSLDLGNFESV